MMKDVKGLHVDVQVQAARAWYMVQSINHSNDESEETSLQQGVLHSYVHQS